MDIEEFEQGLSTIIGRPTGARPFICSGNPLDCEIFLVGINPATSMSADFWDYWVPGTGYDKAEWMERYISERAAKPLKPNRTRRQKISATRRLIGHFTEGAAPRQVLETNAHPYPSEDATGLRADRIDTRTIEFLLSSIQPKVMVIHGGLAVEAMKRVSFSGEVLIAEQHFSRGTSNAYARDLGRKAAETC